MVTAQEIRVRLERDLPKWEELRDAARRKVGYSRGHADRPVSEATSRAATGFFVLGHYGDCIIAMQLKPGGGSFDLIGSDRRPVSDEMLELAYGQSSAWFNPDAYASENLQ